MATIAGRYEVVSKIGEGGMGVVFRAYDPPPLSRHVALKTLHEFSDPSALELFYRECSALKSITHPNIVEIFDIGEYEQEGHRKPFFVMPLLQGQTLDELIRVSSHHLTVERVIDIFAQTCRGLQAAHDHGLIHRDLKPSNIFVLRDDSVKIIDFGIAHAVSAESRTREFKKGTLLYMAPEQLQLKPPSVQSDIYSLGVTLYEALTRTRPFRGATEDALIQAILHEMPPPASEINPAISHLVSRVVHKAMAKQSWNRFDTAREFGDTLQKAARNEPIAYFDPSKTQPRIQTARRALERGDHQFALEIVNELEGEGNIDPEITLVRTEIEKVIRQKTIGQLLESARAREQEGEDLLALSKLHELLQLDPTNILALTQKSRIEDRRSEVQIEKWIQLARQHMDHHAYGHAREALQNALALRPRDPAVAKLLKAIEIAENDYLRLRQEKSDLYQAARNAWQNGEISQALSRMGAVIELDAKAPDISSPDASAKYQIFYDKLRSEQEAINNAYAEARRHLGEKRFEAALEICANFLSRYPGQALFQALKFDAEEQQRQQLSAYIADVDHRLEQEPDLDAKVSLLREALERYPDEEHFKRRLAFFDDRRVHLKAILERARVHEANGRIAEALADLDTLNTIHSGYPGVAFERDRLRKRLEQQTRDAARAAWTRQIDRQLESSNYTAAEELLEQALREFPNDADLVAMRRLAEQARDRARRADELVGEGKQLCASGQFQRGVEVLRIALQLDDRTSIRHTLRDVFVAHAQQSTHSDWRLVQSLAEQALEIDPNHALAKNLRAQALDRKREEETSRFVAEARRLQAAGDVAGALEEANRGLAAFPGDPRLMVVSEALQNEQSRIIRLAERTLEPVSPPQPGISGPIEHVEAPPKIPPPPDNRLSRVSDPTEIPTRAGFFEGFFSRHVIWGSIGAIGVLVLGTLLLRSGDESKALSTSHQPVPAPVSTPAPAVSSALSLQGMPAGLQVLLDGMPVGTVGEGGEFSYTQISPGRHTVLLTMTEYEPFTIEQEFIASNTLRLSNVDVPLTRRPGSVEFQANGGTVITVSQAGRPIQRLAGGGKISVPEGVYDIGAVGPAGVSATRTLRITAGSSSVFDVRRFVVTGMEQFDSSGWARADGWFTRRGGGAILYKQPSPNGRFSFTVQRRLFSGNARLKWIVGYIDEKDYVLLELTKDRLERSDVVNGALVETAHVPHNIPNPPYVFIGAQISGSRLLHQFSTDGRNWRVLDDWTRKVPRGTGSRRGTQFDGRFGFLLRDGEEVFISNFVFYPDYR